ncbi:MAG: GNAT family N-acetyltransferase [Vicinamibacteria bacterium]
MSRSRIVGLTPFSIRRAQIGDEAILRSLRLDALGEAPQAFGSTRERELARTITDWQRWLSPGATFLLETEDGAKGLVAGSRSAANPLTVDLMAMWVHPDWRRSGAADALVSAVVSWAVAESATEVRLRVIEKNHRAIRCYERNGFRLRGQPELGAQSRQIEIEMSKSASNSVRAS